MQPKLRPLDIRPIRHQGQPALLLRDPLALSDQTIVVPQGLAPLLPLLDGSRDERAILASLEIRAGVRLSLSALDRLLSQLDQALLLDNDHSARAREEQLCLYRSADCRPPALAGQGYPAEPEMLQRLLQGYVDSAPPASPGAEPERPIRGLVSPHIDFQRGHAVYAQVWREAAAAVQEAELAVILGTDHMDGTGTITLTRQSYATPWGTLPTARLVVEVAARAMGQEAAFQQELHHRSEHSIEMAAVWLHFVRGGREIPLVPVLCGALDPLLGGGNGQDLSHLAAAAEALRRATARYRTLVVAAGDLAHVGPAFGDGYGVDILGRARLRSSDEALLQAACTGDADAFVQQARAQGNGRRVCGLFPIALALRILEPAQGTMVGYAQCPADESGASWVSIGGITWR